MGLREFVGYIALQILANRINVVDAVYTYFVLNGSVGNVSRIAEMHGLDKKQLAGYVRRCVEKAGDARRARIFAKYVIPIAKEVVKPIIEDCDSGNVARCRLCGERMPFKAVPDHLWNRHWDAISAAVEKIIEVLKQLCRTCRNQGG